VGNFVETDASPNESVQTFVSCGMSSPLGQGAGKEMTQNLEYASANTPKYNIFSSEKTKNIRFLIRRRKQ
jgi:hypothetical protein